jgi:hypothetical protein
MDESLGYAIADKSEPPNVALQHFAKGCPNHEAKSNASASPTRQNLIERKQSGVAAGIGVIQ